MSGLPVRARVRVAIAGYGLAGEVFHAPLIAATDGLVVAADDVRSRAREAGAGGARAGGVHANGERYLSLAGSPPSATVARAIVRW